MLCTTKNNVKWYQLPQFVSSNLNNLQAEFYSSEIIGNTIFDTSGFGHNGTIRPGVSQSTPIHISDVFGNNLLFNGLTGYIDTTSFALTNTTDSLSFEFVCKGSTFITIQTLIGDAFQLPSAGYLWIYRAGDNALYIQYADGITIRSVGAGGYFTGLDNTYIHIIVTINYNTGIIKFYRNGVLFTTKTAILPMLFPSANRIKYIGAFSATKHFWNGIINKVSIYDIELSETDANTNYINSPITYLQNSVT